MNELKQKMEKTLYKNYEPVKGLGADEIDQAIRDIIALPDMVELKKKAEEWDRLKELSGLSSPEEIIEANTVLVSIARAIQKFTGSNNIEDSLSLIGKWEKTAEKYKEEDSHKAYIYDEITKQIGCIFNPVEIKEWKEGKEKWEKYKSMSCSLLMQEEKKKALKYDKLFSELQVVEECKYNKSLDCTKSDCPHCNATGKIYRELTETEKEEVIKIKTLLQKDLLTPVLGFFILESGIRVEVKK